jgi:hypothetical protein
MTGRIDWDRRSGEEVEQAIAVLICRKYPTACHIRPSQGDKGIDVQIKNEDGTLTIYQIKKFSQNLTVSQKKQIKNSWLHLQKWLSEPETILKEWHLAMPLDPTTQNLDWLTSVTAPIDVNIVWDGLTNVEAWATEFPEVIDYYFWDGRERVAEQVERALSAARSPKGTSPDDIEQQLRSIKLILDEQDPNYTYSFSLHSKHEKQMPSPNIRPGLIMSTIEELPEGGYLVIDYFAKHAAATDLVPISFKTTITASTPEDKKQLEDFIDYGTPFHNLTAEIENPSALPFPTDKGSESGKISAFAYKNNAESRKVKLVNDKFMTISLNQEDLTRGENGLRWKGSDCTRFLHFEISVNQKGNSKIQFSWRTERLCGSRVADVKRVVDFFSNSIEGSICIQLDSHVISSFQLEDLNLLDSFTEDLQELVANLQTINEHSDKEILFPDTTKLPSGKFNELERAANLITYGYDLNNWDTLDFGTESTIELPGMPLYMKYTHKLELSLMSEVYELGFTSNRFIAERVEQAQKPKKGLVFYPGDKYQNTLIRNFVARSEIDPQTLNQLFCAPAPNPDNWNEEITGLSNGNIPAIPQIVNNNS